MSAELFETKPRWPGCPPICIRVNLPAFKTEKELYKFAGDNHPSVPVAHVGKCKSCDHFHYRTEKAEQEKTEPNQQPEIKSSAKPSVGIPTPKKRVAQEYLL